MTRPGERRALYLICAVLILPFLGGCVERTLIIRSDPAGARAVVNGVDMGSTPAVIPFQTYGVYDVALSREGYRRMSASVPVRPPWYERVPIDFFAEVLWPFTVQDYHEVTLSLQPTVPADESGVDERETELRERLENPGE